MGILFLPVYTIPTLLTRPDLFRELGDQIIASSIASYVVRVLQQVYLLGMSLSTFNYIAFCLHFFYITHLMSSTFSDFPLRMYIDGGEITLSSKIK